MRPLRILQVVHSFPPHNIAGTEVYTCNLSRELAKRHEVSIFHRINDKQKGEFEIAQSEHNGLHIHTINNTFKDCDSFEMIYDNKIITEAFENLLNEINPDVVHIQHLLFLSIGIIRAAKERNIPVVFTLHDYWLLCPQGQLLKSNTRVCQQYTASDCVRCMKYQLSLKKRAMHIYWSLRNALPDFLMRAIKNIYFVCVRLLFLSREEEKRQIELRQIRLRQASEMVDIFLAPSQFLRNKFIDFGIPESKIINFPYGLDQSYFKENNLKGKRDKFYFVFIGTLLPSKGVHLLIQAFKRMNRANVELKIYGSENVYRGLEYYLGHIKRIGRGKNIRFMGGYKNEDVGSILLEADVLVIPSIWYENSPLVIQEAFLAKRLVIASRIGGIPELVNDGVNGLLFNPGNVKDLQEKMECIIDNPDIIEKFKRNMPLIKSIEDNAKEMEEIYINLISKK